MVLSLLSNHLEWPLTIPNHPIFYFYITFPIFIAGGDSDFRFDAYADCSKSRPMDDHLWKGRGHGYVAHCKFLELQSSLEWLRFTVNKFCTHMGVSSVNFKMTNNPQMGVVRSCDPFLNFGNPVISLEWVKQIRCACCMIHYPWRGCVQGCMTALIFFKK